MSVYLTFYMGIICPLLNLVSLLSSSVLTELEHGWGVGLTVTESPERDVVQAGVSELPIPGSTACSEAAAEVTFISSFHAPCFPMEQESIQSTC